MNDPQVGWIAATSSSAVSQAGSHKLFMKSDIGLVMHIVLGIAGAAVASATMKNYSAISNAERHARLAGELADTLFAKIGHSAMHRVFRAPGGPLRLPN